MARQLPRRFQPYTSPLLMLRPARMGRATCSKRYGHSLKQQQAAYRHTHRLSGTSSTQCLPTLGDWHFQRHLAARTAWTASTEPKNNSWYRWTTSTEFHKSSVQEDRPSKRGRHGAFSALQPAGEPKKQERKAQSVSKALRAATGRSNTPESPFATQLVCQRGC